MKTDGPAIKRGALVRGVLAGRACQPELTEFTRFVDSEPRASHIGETRKKRDVPPPVDPYPTLGRILSATHYRIWAWDELNVRLHAYQETSKHGRYRPSIASPPNEPAPCRRCDSKNNQKSDRMDT